MSNEQGRRPVSTVRRTAQIVFGVLVGVPTILFWCVLVLFLSLTLLISGGNESCNVAHIRLHGILATTDSGIADMVGLGIIASSERIVGEIRDAAGNDDVRAVILDIDSPGGTPVAGDEIMRALQTLDKPSVAVIRDMGTSAAYWAAAGATTIIASPVSDVGSIGVTMSYRETADSKDREGSRWIDISSGLHKDAGNPDRVLTADEQAFFTGEVKQVHDYMVSQIANARPVLTHDALATLTDGRAYVGSEALQLQLVDALGSFDEALQYIETKLGMTKDDAVLCDPADSGLASLLSN